jgi:hypothetical protein
MEASAGGTDRDLAVTQFPRNCVTKTFILLYQFSSETVHKLASSDRVVAFLDNRSCGIVGIKRK